MGSMEGQLRCFFTSYVPRLAAAWLLFYVHEVDIVDLNAVVDKSLSFCEHLFDRGGIVVGTELAPALRPHVAGWLSHEDAFRFLVEGPGHLRYDRPVRQRAEPPAVIVIAEGTCMVRLLQVLSRFYAHESCGQCTPCREGTGWLNRTLKRILAGQGRQADIDMLVDVANKVVLDVLSYEGAITDAEHDLARARATLGNLLGRQPVNP